MIQAVRGAVVYATIDEIRTQGERLARTTLQRLQAMQLSKIIGLEVLNVLVTAIETTDTAQDPLAAQEMKHYTTMREWELEQHTTAQSQVSWEWLLVHRPDVANRQK